MAKELTRVAASCVNNQLLKTSQKRDLWDQNLLGKGHLSATRKRVDAQQFIQHAWARAVKEDTTFIIFSCGMYERIGDRHRATQTLYLSPLIDPVNNRNPSYGKLNFGLFSAISQDLLERFENERNSKSTTDYQDAMRKKKKVKKTTSSHQIGYDEPHFSVLPRPALPVPPETFHSTSKSKFRATGYIDMTLSQPMGKGAVGVVHPATVSIEVESGDVVEHKLVVKLAFSRTQKAGLRHEYDVYSHFAKAGYVGDIVDVHGLFEDPDSNTLALVMENGGRSLAHLNDEEEDGVGQVTGDNRTTCMNDLKSIHAAGVHHGDIRPHNVLFDDKGRVKIIDFDSSTFDPDQINERMFENELSRLEAVLDGSYVDGGW
ncbi:hypothetical protein CPC08DRAFT_725786 [Agrocybe pediades]|nr:hypothetical protein CPC08DRAFT_725786 [Agrocybe pediades]